MTDRKKVWHFFYPGSQPVTSDSKTEPHIVATGCDDRRVPSDVLSRIFTHDLLLLAQKHIEVAFRIYLSPHASIHPDGSVTFEDDEIKLPIDVKKPKNKFVRYG